MSVIFVQAFSNDIILDLLDRAKVGLIGSNRGNPKVSPTRPVFTPLSLKVAWSRKSLIRTGWVLHGRPFYVLRSIDSPGAGALPSVPGHLSWVGPDGLWHHQLGV